MIWSPSADHLKYDLKPDLVTNVVLPKQDLVTNASLPKPDLVTNASRPKPDLITNAVLPKLDLVNNAVLPKSDLAPVRIRSKNGILLQKGIHYNNCTATTTIQLHRFSFSTTLFQHTQRFNYIDFLSPPRSFSIQRRVHPFPLFTSWWILSPLLLSSSTTVHDPTRISLSTTPSRLPMTCIVKQRSRSALHIKEK